MIRQATGLPAPDATLALAPPPRPYDPEMIEDFLRQLLWELRIDHSGWADADDRGPADRRTDARLAPYIERRGSLLLPAVALKGEVDLTPQQEQLFRSRMGALRQRQVDALEVLLEGLIPEVLRYAGESAVDGSAARLVVDVDARSMLGPEHSAENAGS
jgi:hypothetical protein